MIIHLQFESGSTLGGGNRYRLNFFKSLPSLKFVLINSRDSNNKSPFSKLKNLNEVSLSKKHPQKISIFSLPYYLFCDLIYLYQLKKILKKNKSAIVHLHGISFIKTFQILVKIFGITPYKLLLGYLFSGFDKLVLTLHNLHSIENSINNYIYKYHIEFFDRIICVDEHIFNYAKKKSKTVKDIYFIPNSVKLNRSNNILRHEKIVIGFAGRISPATLDVKIIEELANKLSDKFIFKLAVIGKLLNINARENVHVSHDLDDTEMEKFYESVDVLFNPITHGAMSRVTLEAMSYGIPVMMYDYSKRSQYFNKRNGIEIKPDTEKILRILDSFASNRNKLSELGKNARKVIAENYSNEKVMTSIIKIYKKLENE